MPCYKISRRGGRQKPYRRSAVDEKAKLAAEITRDIVVSLIGRTNPLSREVTVDGKKVNVHDYSFEICRHWKEIFKTVYSALGGKD
jgi:hypothetical protein